MNLPIGRSVRLFLVDGTATGPTTAEIMNWTGHVLTGSRTGLPAFLKRPELNRTGIYFLTGLDPKDPDTLQLYVGESDNVGERLVQHSRDKLKDFWEHTCVVTSKDQNITKAHVRYLEARLFRIAETVGTASLVNSARPSDVALPEADESDMEYFIDQLRLILPVLGLDFLRRPKAPAEINAKPVDKPGAIEPPALFQLISKKHKLEAQAREIDGEFVVLDGSHVAKEWSSKSDHSYARRREQLIKTGKIIPGNDGHLCFAADVPFQSPSAASAVILGRPDNGRVSWKVANSKVSYGDWQSEQVVKAASKVSNAEDGSSGRSPGVVS